MKLISLSILSSFLALSTFSQSNTVTIHITGNKNRQVWVDDKNYSEVSRNTQGNIVINDLQAGQHTLKMIVVNQNTSNVNSTPFNTKIGKDLLITINTSGSVQLKEFKSKTTSGSNHPNSSLPNRNAMSDSRFSIVLDDVRKQWTTGAKMTAATNVFSYTSNIFSTRQARQIIALVNGESNRLQLAKLSYKDIADISNFSQLSDLLTDQASKDELSAYAANFSSLKNERTALKAMSEPSFNILLKDIEKQWLPGAKMTALRNAFANSSNFFNISEARQLILLVTDESNRLQLAKSSYRSIVDTSNFNQLYDLLTNQSSKDELTSYVKAYNTRSVPVTTNGSVNGQVKSEMSEANFNALALNIQNQWIPGSRMSAISNAFANTSNYFSTAQARKLIQYVTDEANRLQLAKLSYRNIIDPANFKKLDDLFTLQSSKTELASYVRNFKP